MPQHRPKRYVIVDWLCDYRFGIATILMPILAGLAALSYSDEFIRIFKHNSTRHKWFVGGVVFFILVLLAQAILGVIGLSREKRLSRLEAAAATSDDWIQDIFAICGDYLYVLATHSGLAFGAADRISLYAHDSANGSFLLLGRFSQNDIWRQPGRKSYPIGQGCIGKAWAEGDAFISELPPCDQPAFLQKCLEYGLTKVQVERLRMPSRFYYGWKILNPAGNQGVAVLIIESTTIKRYQLGVLRDMFAGERGHTLRTFVERIRPKVPSIRVAAQAGF